MHSKLLDDMRPLLALAMLGALLSVASAAQASAARLVILPKHQVDGAQASSDAMEAALARALGEVGVRVVDLDAALRAQRTSFAESVLAGSLPDELSVLNADVVGAFQLACDRSAARTFGTDLQAYYCVLSSKLIRVDSGDVIFSGTDELTGHGLNARMAVQQAVKQLDGEVSRGAQTWLASLSGEGAWDVDLTVAGIHDRTRAKRIAELLASTDGVEARLVLFRKQLAKYTLSGDDAAVLQGLADAIEANQAVPLEITYQAGRVLHAQLALSKVHRFGALALSVAPKQGAGAVPASLAADLLTSELSNLPYLELAAPYRPTSATPAQQTAREKALLQRARSQGLPLVLVASLLPQKDSYAAQLQLRATRHGGRVVAASNGEGETAAEALAAARRGLDDGFREALIQPDVQALLDVSAEDARMASAQGLRVASFTARSQGDDAARARLALRNSTGAPITGGRITFQATDAVRVERALSEIPAGDTTTIVAPLSGLPSVGDAHMEIVAVVEYVDGDVHRRLDATAVLLAPGGSLPPPYRRAVVQAWQALDGRAYARARDLAQRAHGIRSTAKALMMIGIAELGLARYREGIDLLRRALDARSFPLQAADRQLAQRAIAAARKELGDEV